MRAVQGFYFKLAQILSTRNEFLPDQYMEWCCKLQDRSPRVMPSHEAKAAVEEALGVGDISELFTDWEDKEIGSASIGQVHRAKLRATGEQVAIKIMFPGIEEKFRSDFYTVETFCKWLMPARVSFLAEIKKQFSSEFDYEREARNLQEVGELLKNSPWADKVAVPVPIPELCTKTVLTMTYLPGERLVDGIRSHYQGVADKLGMDFDKMVEQQKSKLLSGQLERRTLDEFSRTEWILGWALWLSDLAKNSVIFLGNWTVVPLIYEKPIEYVHSQLPVNLSAIIETLLRVHAYEIFFGRGFNSDPHPGNILLMPCGRLGLIDYGQFKQLKLEDRIHYAKIVLALHRDDPEEVNRLYEEAGFATKHMNSDLRYRAACFWNDRDTTSITMGKNVHQFLEWIDKLDPPTAVNDEFVMVARVSVLLRGLANAFGVKLRVTDYWHLEAEQFLKEQGIAY